MSFFCVCCGFFSFIRGLWYHSPGIQHIIPYGIVHIHTRAYRHTRVYTHTIGTYVGICISSSKVFRCHKFSEVLFGFVLPVVVCCVMLNFYHEIKIDRAHTHTYEDS